MHDVTFKVIKISTRRKRQDRVVFFKVCGVVVADTEEVIHRILPWRCMEGFRTQGSGHGAMVVFRCREEPDVCVELQGDPRKSPDEVLAALAEHARLLGLECIAMPAGTDMAAEEVCRRQGRAKVTPRKRLAEGLTPAAAAAACGGGAGGDNDKIAIHPQLAKVLGSSVSKLRFLGVVDTVNKKGACKKSLLMVIPDRLVTARMDGAVRRMVAMRDVEEIVTLADGSTTPLRIRFRVRADADLVVHWISDPLSSHPAADALVRDLCEAVPQSILWRAVYDLQHFSEGS